MCGNAQSKVSDILSFTSGFANDDVNSIFSFYWNIVCRTLASVYKSTIGEQVYVVTMFSMVHRDTGAPVQA